MSIKRGGNYKRSLYKGTSRIAQVYQGEQMMYDVFRNNKDQMFLSIGSNMIRFDAKTLMYNLRNDSDSSIAVYYKGNYIYKRLGQTIRRYNMNMTYVGETTPEIGFVPFGMIIVGDFIYVGTAKDGMPGATIKKYNLSDLSYANVESPQIYVATHSWDSTDTSVLATDGTYLYATGYGILNDDTGVARIKKYNLNDLSEVAETPVLGWAVAHMHIKDGFATCVSTDTQDELRRINLSNMTISATTNILTNESITTVGFGYRIACSDDYIYGCTPRHNFLSGIDEIRKYSRSTLAYTNVISNDGLDTRVHRALAVHDNKLFTYCRKDIGDYNYHWQIKTLSLVDLSYLNIDSMVFTQHWWNVNRLLFKEE